MHPLDTTWRGFKFLLLTAGIVIGSVQSFFVLAVLVICTSGVGLIPLLLVSSLVGFGVRVVWCPAWLQRLPVLFGFLFLVVGSGVAVAGGVLAYLTIVTFGLALVAVLLLSCALGLLILAIAGPAQGVTAATELGARSSRRISVLARYALQGRQQGLSPAAIESNARAAGWTREEIQEALTQGPR